jgi:hypothetical protein
MMPPCTLARIGETSAAAYIQAMARPKMPTGQLSNSTNQREALIAISLAHRQ